MAGDDDTGLPHGGRLQEARRRFPDAPQPLLDLSTGINPHNYPLPPVAAEALRRLPDPDDERALRDAAAQCYGVPHRGFVAAAPGSQILISLLPVLLAVDRAVVLGPTYGEHEAAWRNAGLPVEVVEHPDALAARAAPETALVLCEPNNPDGRRLGTTALRRLARRVSEKGGRLVVDEAFADLEPGVGCVAAPVPLPGVCALRSFGKSFGLAGLRLGFLLGTPDLVTRCRRLIGPWAVGGPAIAAGLLALPDARWRAEAVVRLAADRDRMDRTLSAAGWRVLGGTRMFRLAAAADAGSRWERLGQAGVLARRFDHRADWLRFGLPGTDGEWSRLEEALGRG